MYGYIYKTTNLVNGKIYIGKKESPVFDVNYWGSGKYFKQAFKKYGAQNFSREILEWADTLEDLNRKEQKWIALYHLPDLKIGYNISAGGDGGNTWLTYSDSQKLERNNKRNQTLSHNKTSSKGKIVVNNQEINRLILPEELSRYLNEGWQKGSIYKGRKPSKETLEKLSISHKGKISGTKGKIRIYNLVTNKVKYINKSDLSFYLNQKDWEKGGVKGKKASPETIYKLKISHKGQKAEKGRISIHKDRKEKHVLPSDYNEYINKGWIKGRLPRTEKHRLNLSKANKGQISRFKGMVYINNGKNEKRVNRTALQEYLLENWVVGRISKKI